MEIGDKERNMNCRNCGTIVDLKYEPHVCKNCIMEYLKESKIQRKYWENYATTLGMSMLVR